MKDKALGITAEDVSKGHFVRKAVCLTLTVHWLLLEAKMKIEPPLDVKRKSLNLAGLLIAWEETSTFRSY